MGVGRRGEGLGTGERRPGCSVPGLPWVNIPSQDHVLTCSGAWPPGGSCHTHTVCPIFNHGVSPDLASPAAKTTCGVSLPFRSACAKVPIPSVPSVFFLSLRKEFYFKSSGCFLTFLFQSVQDSQDSSLPHISLST